MDGQQPLTGILRKALVVATKLLVDELKDWCNHEINGYFGVKRDEIPDYRWLEGTLQAQNPVTRSWDPLVGLQSDIYVLLARQPMVQPVSALEDILRELDEKGRGIPHIPLSQELLEPLFGREWWFESGVRPVVVMQRSQIASVLESVRGKILTWSLELEQLGVHGEGMSFSREESRKAQQATFHIVGGAGDMNITVGSTIGGDLLAGRGHRVDHGGSEEMRQVLSQLEQHVNNLLPQLEPEKAAQAKRDFDAFVQEVTSDNPREKWYTVTGEGLVEAAESVLTFPARVIKEYVAVAVSYVKAKAGAVG